MRTIWIESNSSAFEGIERATMDLNMILSHAFYDRMATLCGHPIYNLLEFLDFCKFSWFVLPSKYTTYVLDMLFLYF